MDGNKKALAVLSACLLALVPWMQISKAVSADVSVSLAALGAVVAAGVAVHLAFLAFNMTAVRMLGIGGQDGDACELLPLSVARTSCISILPTTLDNRRETCCPLETSTLHVSLGDGVSCSMFQCKIFFWGSKV